MKNHQRIFLTIVFLLSFFIVVAQTPTEICDNGKDDDMDNRVDCFDTDCASNPSCDEFFFGNAAACLAEINVQSFAIRQQWGSADQTATSHASPVVGDLDQNGIPEVIAVNNVTETVTVLNGATGATIASIGVGFTPENTPAIANVFRDETAEILVTHNEGSRLVLFKGDLSGAIWRVNSSQENMGIAGFADFNEDGVPEVYYKNEIRNARTGSVIVAGDGDWSRDYVQAPIAVDILDDAECPDCAGLELITGRHIWAINIAAGSRTIAKDMNVVLTGQGITGAYFPKYWGNAFPRTRSSVSIADYNLDGKIDVLLSGALGTNGADSTTIFFWNVAADSVITYRDPSNNFVRGPGRINIGDVDGDGKLNANFVMNQKLYSLDENFEIHWIKAIKEGTSGFTGCTLFDFDGDGIVETVYRSEESVLIVDGVSGDTRASFPCISRTQEEYPIVADVDGDGASEICVACYTSDVTSFTPYGNTKYSQIRVYESKGEAWMPARSVWNQHGYFNVNINDDLTVPLELQNHVLAFSDSTCKYADGSSIPFPSRPLNTFLTQSPILDENGCVEFVAPDIVLLGNAISATDAQCPNAEITVTLTLTNGGDVGVSAGLPISYYAGNPTEVGSTYLDTEIEFLTNFQPGQTLEITQEIIGIGGNFDLYVVANDLGGTPAITSSPRAYEELPSATVIECKTANNYNFVNISFDPFNLTVEKLEDDRRCDLSKTPNGSAKAFYFGANSAEDESIYLENFDDRAIGAQSDSDGTAWSSNPGTVGPTFYGVSDFVERPQSAKTFRATGTGGADSVGVVEWISQAIDISNYVNVSATLDIFEQGILETTSSNLVDYYVAEYETRSNTNSVISSGTFTTNGSVNGDFNYLQASLDNIRPNHNDRDSLLVIKVKFHNTGGQEHFYLDNINVSGTKPSETKERSEADGYQFRWYRQGDYSTVLHSGSTYSQLSAGTYDVISSLPSKKCGSDTVSIEIVTLNATSTPPYEVNTWMYEISPLDDCNVPNGSLGAFVYTQTLDGTFPASATNPPQDTLRTVDGYTFSWRATNDATNTSIGISDELQNLSNQSYTVDVTEGFSGCVASTALTVSSGLTLSPDPNITIVNISSCGGSGTLSADVSGNTADYTFEWFDGPVAKPSVDFRGTTYTVSSPGQYSVRAIQTSSSCPSGLVTATIANNASAPTGAVTLVANNTSCVSGNGIISANGDGAGTVAGFTFSWFKGLNTLPASTLPGPANPNSFLVNNNIHELGGLTEGDYRVVITESATACTDTLDIAVQDMPRPITATPSNMIVNNINSCDLTALGSIDATGILPGNQTISLGNINGDFEVPDITGNFQQLDQTLVNGWSTTAADNKIEIWTSGFQGTPSYSGNQHAEVNATQVAALFFDLSTTPGTLLDWSFAHRGRSGDDEISVNIGGPTAEVRQGTFTTDNVAWSVYSGLYTIPNGQFTTRFQFEAVTATGGPSTGNFIDSVTFVLFPYRFELYRGTNTSGTADFINTSGVFNDLDNGNYVLVAHDNLTGCAIAEMPISVNRTSEQPTVVTNLAHDSNCGTGAGTINVTSSMSGSEPRSYTYQLFDGHGFTTQNGADVSIADGSVSYPFQNIQAGNYRVNVINGDTKCSEFVDIVINSETITPAILATQADVNTSCATANGAVSVTVDANLDGTAETASEFSFTWHDGNGTSDPVISGASGVMGLDSLNSSNGFMLDAGFYTVVARSIATGCETAPTTLQIYDTPYRPNIVITEVSPYTACSTPNNGSLAAYVSNGPNGCTRCTEADGFTFQWQLNGVDLPGITTSTATGLAATTYTAIVTHDASACTATAHGTVTSNQVQPVVTLNTVQNNTSCSASSTGSILVNVTPVDTYSFSWFTGQGSPIVDGGSISGSITSNLTGIAGDSYRVLVTSSLGCESQLVISVDDVPENPNFGVSIAVNNSTCSNTGGRNHNGQITVASTDGTSNSAYSYEWFTGASTSPANLLLTTTPTASISATGNSSSQLPGGTYTVVITSNNGNSCSTTLQQTILNDLAPPIISLSGAGSTTTDLTVCEDHSSWPNGAVNANVTDGSGNYSYAWYYGTSANATQLISNNDDIATRKGSGGTAPNAHVRGANTENIGNLDPGFYTLVVTDTDRGCLSSPVTFELMDNQPPVDWTASVNSSNHACVGSTPTGEVTVGQNSGTSTYSVEWYAGGSPSGTVLATTETYSNIEGGSYTVKVIDDVTSCFTVESVTVPEFTPTLTVTTSSTSQTRCMPPDGTATVVANTAFSPSSPTPLGYNGGMYRYDWFLGGDISTPLVEGVNGTNVTTATVSNLFAGFYTVVVSDTIIGCVAAQETVQVADSITSQAPTAFISGATADGAPRNTPGDCAMEDGYVIAMITASAPGRTYTYQWYEGSLDFASNPTAGTPLVDAGTTPPTTYMTAQGASAAYVVDDSGGLQTSLVSVTSGLYTLVMTDVLTKCRYQQVYDLPYIDQQGTITLALRHVESCLGYGETAIGIEEDGDGIYLAGEAEDIKQYDIYLFAGSGIPAVFYSDNTFTYTITNADGTTSIFPKKIDGDATTVRTGMPVSFTQLPSGTYTAIAREKDSFSLSECWTRAVVGEIETRAFDPILGNVVVTDNTTCSVPPATANNGAITATAVKNSKDNQAGDFRFVWYNETTDPNHTTPLQTDDLVTTTTLDSLNVGDYAVDILRVVPTFDVAYTAGGAFRNGEILTFTGGSGATAVILTTRTDTLNVYLTSGTITNGDIITSASSVRTGTVTVAVAGAVHVNGCSITEVITIHDNSETHAILGPLGVTDANDCSPADSGIITMTDANVTSGATADYEFAFYSTLMNALSATSPLQAFGVDSTYVAPAPAAGTYYVVAEHQASGCTTVPFEVEINNVEVNPSVTLTGNDDTSCDVAPNEGNGSIQFTMTNTPTGQYSYQWYTGTTNGSQLVATGSIANVSGTITTPGPYTATLENIDAGTYTLEIIDQVTPYLNCLVLSTITINEVIARPHLVVTDNYALQDNQNCTGPNGSIKITSVKEGVVDMAVTATNYSFTWFKNGIAFNAPTDGSIASTIGVDNEITELDNGTYSVVVRNESTRCESTTAIEIEVTDVHTNPVVNLARTPSGNTFCDTGNLGGDGTLGISVTEAGMIPVFADYKISWYRGAVAGTNPIYSAGPNTGTLQSNPDSTELTGLSDGDYTVVINKISTPPNLGCATTATYTVRQMSEIPILDATSIQARVRPDTLCNTNVPPHSGVIIIEDNDFGPIANGLNDLGLYDITIRENSATGTVIGQYTNTTLTSITEDGLMADDYYISAIHTTTKCEVATTIINVPDSVRAPQIKLVSVTPDRDCTGGTSNVGGLEIIIDNQFTQADHFTVQWHTGFGATNPITGANTVTLSNVEAGDYSVGVVNSNTNCLQMADFTIPNEPIMPAIFNYTVIDNSVCDDDNDNMPVDMGSFELIEAVFDGAVLDQTAMTNNYRLEIYDDAGLATATTDGDGDMDNFIYTELNAGDYYAIVRNLSTNCPSNGLMFEVEDILERPLITIVLQEADSICAGGSAPNGTLFATVDGGIQHTDPNYTFQWYSGSGTGGATLVNTSTISGLVTGTYTVEVTLNSTGCTSTDEFIVPNVPASVRILTVDTTASTTCMPGNGIIEVTGVNLDNIADYTFDYYDTDPTVTPTPTPVFTGLAGASFTAAIGEVIYYIIGTNTISNCQTGPYQIFVNQGSTFPSITLVNGDDGNNENCDQANLNGFLSIEVGGVVPTSPAYTIQWYIGSGTTTILTDAIIGGNGTLVGETTARVSGIPGGLYTVRVLDNTTECASTFEAEIEDRPREVLFNVNTSPVTSCTDPNGTMTVQIVKGLPVSSYDIYWFNGAQSEPDTTNANFTGGSIVDLPDTTYTVSVVEKSDRFCQVVETFDIMDSTSPPDYTLEIVSDVTVCFSAKDGFAQVTFPDASLVNIEWLNDTNTVISNQTFADSLDVGSYTLKLTDVNTGCMVEEIFSIDNIADIPSIPTIIVNNDRTNCADENGSAVANVDGIQNGFLFEWFAQDDLMTPYTTGAEVFNLDSTTYLVKATNLATSCESALASVNIEYDITDPVFEIQSSIVACLRTEDGATNQFNGSAIVGFEQFNEVQEYRWEDESKNILGTDARLIDVGPGTYTVFFTAGNGCEYSETFTMTTDITVYNGISANGDGLNDFLLIDCVDYFTNNSVSIFNRAGAKVYEINSYDNVSSRFEGSSNVGTSELSLPTGTYFYVIDKGDGSDLIQGFLELVR